MRKLLATLLLFTGLHAFAQSSDDTFVEKTLYPATVILFSQLEDGGFRMRCTATAFEKTDDGYRFVTAAHCAAISTDAKDKDYVEDQEYYVSSDGVGSKDYIPVRVKFCGKRGRGDDFCVFEAKTAHVFPVVELGTDPVSVAGEPVVDIAAPLGVGKLVLDGRITKPVVDRKILGEDGINWTGGEMLVLPGTEGGASGSAIVCLRQRAICGFLVGTLGQNHSNIVALPVSRFKKFYEEAEAGKYKWFSKEEE